MIILISMEHSETYANDIQDQWQEIRYEELCDWLAVRPSEWNIRQWSLVLDARSIPCQIQVADGRWHLLVPPEQLAAAIQELRSYHRNNRNWPPVRLPGRPLVQNTLATISILFLLATFHNITQLDGPICAVSMPDWWALGSAQAARIQDGEWWRLVTALTLHADWAHLSANLAIGGIFMIFLCQELGSGLAWSLLLSAGILGNLVNAFLQQPGHNSLGASTAVFGAVGILASLSLVRHRQQLQRRWPLPAAAALALLAILGTEGKNTDLGAHLFGFVYGSSLGVIAEYLITRYGRPGLKLNRLLALLSVIVVVCSWWAALQSAG